MAKPRDMKKKEGGATPPKKKAMYLHRTELRRKLSLVSRRFKNLSSSETAAKRRIENERREDAR